MYTSVVLSIVCYDYFQFIYSFYSLTSAQKVRGNEMKYKIIQNTRITDKIELRI